MVIRSLMAKCCVLTQENCGIILPADGNFRLIVEWRTGGVPMTKKTKNKAQKKAEEEQTLTRRWLKRSRLATRSQ